MDNQQLQALHLQSSQHLECIQQNQKCGCFYCLKIFDATEITDWVDDEQTAICPHCGIDAVLAENDEQVLDQAILKEMHDYYFG